MEETKKEMVAHPQHYNREGGMECWDEEEIIFGREAMITHLTMSLWEYRYRCNDKNGKQDIEKSDNLMRKIAQLKGWPNTIKASEINKGVINCTEKLPRMTMDEHVQSILLKEDSKNG